MEPSSYDEKQIQSVSNLLTAYGIDPTADTLQALVATAKSSYPDDPDGLQKAAEGMISFFAEPSNPYKQQEVSWNRFRRWVLSVLRIKAIGILPSRDT